MSAKNVCSFFSGLNELDITARWRLRYLYTACRWKQHNVQTSNNTHLTANGMPVSNHHICGYRISIILVRWNLYKATTKFCGFSRQVVFMTGRIHMILLLLTWFTSFFRNNCVSNETSPKGPPRPQKPSCGPSSLKRKVSREVGPAEKSRGPAWQICQRQSP